MTILTLSTIKDDINCSDMRQPSQHTGKVYCHLFIWYNTAKGQKHILVKKHLRGISVSTTDHWVLGLNLTGEQNPSKPKWCLVAQSPSCSLFHHPDKTEIVLKRMCSPKPPIVQVKMQCHSCRGRMVPLGDLQLTLSSHLLGSK